MPDPWEECQLLVFEELKRISGWCGEIAKTQQKTREDIAALKVKAGIWGLVGGLIPVAILLLVQLLKD